MDENQAVSLPENSGFIGSHRQPQISILVPIYNVAKYLPQALNSLLAQTFKNFEVICINDGSRDQSRAIVQQYIDSDPRFKVIDQKNSGYGVSINKGIQAARGKYVGILEPDDFFEPDALEKLFKLAEAHNADVVKANYWFYWSEPKERNEIVHAVTPAMTGHVFKPMEEPEIFFSNPSLWSAIYKRSFILGNGLTLNETPGASFQDLGFTFKIWSCATRVCCIENPILHYRQDNESSSVNNPKKVFCVCDEFDSIEDFIAANPARAVLRPYAYRMRYDSYMWNFERLTLELRCQFMDTMVGDLSRGMQHGDYVPSLFASYQQENLRFLLENPARFLEIYPEHPTRSAKARYYLKIGGPKVLAAALRK